MSSVTVPPSSGLASAWDRVRTYRPPNRYLPIIATAGVVPSVNRLCSETTAVVGKYTWPMASPGSQITEPSGRSIRSSWGAKRRQSAGGSAASRRFACASG